jgi:NAD(P)-dependent dehydrogenase (short-subunit alcohol dehydrogenase family)
MQERPTVLITGASRGLGAETAIATAQLGADLILTARSREGLEATAARVKEKGGRNTLKLLPGDLSDPNFCGELSEKITAEGELQAVVLNAARVDPIGRVTEIDEAEWAQCLELNLTSPFRVARNLLPLLKKSRGRLITIGTGAATTPIASWSGYCTSKAALLMLTRVIAVEYPEVVSLSFTPGVVDTAMQQNIRDSKEAMPGDLAQYFESLHATGQLEPAEVPARALAWCALFAPQQWTGTEISYNDVGLVEAVRQSFPK